MGILASGPAPTINKNGPTGLGVFCFVKDANLSHRRQRGVAGRAAHLTATTLAKPLTVGLSYEALRRECLDAVRQWPGCETVGAIRIIREKMPGDFSIQITLYGKAQKKTADRAMNYVQREKRRHFHLTD